MWKYGGPTHTRINLKHSPILAESAFWRDHMGFQRFIMFHIVSSFIVEDDQRRLIPSNGDNRQRCFFFFLLQAADSLDVTEEHC